MDVAERGLSKLFAPFLNGVASRDDLVAPSSNKILNDVVGSNDKSLVEHYSGHVGLCSNALGFHFTASRRHLLV
jgi:esterase/lipase